MSFVARRLRSARGLRWNVANVPIPTGPAVGVPTTLHVKIKVPATFSLVAQFVALPVLPRKGPSETERFKTL